VEQTSGKGPERRRQKGKDELYSDFIHHLLDAPLTHVVGDDGERLQVGLPDVLCQRVGVLLEVAEQVSGAALRPLDLLPVLLGVRIQYGAARSHQILEETSKNVKSLEIMHQKLWKW